MNKHDANTNINSQNRGEFIKFKYIQCKYTLYGDELPKILTEIIGEHGEIIKRKKYSIDGQTIVVRPAKRGPGGTAYKAKFNRNCLLWRKVGLPGMKSYKPKLMLIDGASGCIEFNSDGVDVPIWDKATEEDLFKANVIKAAGATVQKIQVPTMLYIAIFMVIILQVFTLLTMSGKVRI